jgi:CRP-like cAMP-binding protein
MDAKDKIRFLGQFPMLASLHPDEQAQIAACALHRRIPKLQFIYMPDDPSDHIYFLLRGKVKTGAFSADGREVIKELVQPLAIFGDLALAGETVRVDFARVMHEEAEVLCLSIRDFQVLMQQNQQLLFACMAHLNARLRRAEDRLASLVMKDARERIIEFLVETAGKEGRRVGLETLVKHQLTQQDIANLTGTSRQTVTSVLNDLRKSNLIYFSRNSILIRNIEQLV